LVLGEHAVVRAEGRAQRRRRPLRGETKQRAVRPDGCTAARPRRQRARP
jgi:hypothetical protein